MRASKQSLKHEQNMKSNAIWYNSFYEVIHHGVALHHQHNTNIVSGIYFLGAAIMQDSNDDNNSAIGTTSPGIIHERPAADDDPTSTSPPLTQDVYHVDTTGVNPSLSPKETISPIDIIHCGQSQTSSKRGGSLDAVGMCMYSNTNNLCDTASRFSLGDIIKYPDREYPIPQQMFITENTSIKRADNVDVDNEENNPISDKHSRRVLKGVEDKLQTDKAYKTTKWSHASTTVFIHSEVVQTTSCVDNLDYKPKSVVNEGRRPFEDDQDTTCHFILPSPPQPLIPQREKECISSNWNNTSKTEFLHSHDGKHSITHEDFARLRPGQWVDDAVINLFCRGILQGEFPNALFLSSHFMSQLIKHKPDLRGSVNINEPFYKFDRVSRWTAANKLPGQAKSIFDFETLYIPINKGLNHWIFIWVHIESKELRLYDGKFANVAGDACHVDGSDAANPAEDNVYLKSMRRFLFDSSVKYYDKETTGTYDDWCNNWIIQDCSDDVPLQQDTNSCGLFMLTGIYHLCMDEELKKKSFTQQDINEIRWRVAFILLKGAVLKESDKHDDSSPQEVAPNVIDDSSPAANTRFDNRKSSQEVAPNVIDDSSPAANTRSGNRKSSITTILKKAQNKQKMTMLRGSVEDSDKDDESSFQDPAPNVATCPAANTRFRNRKSSTSTTLKKEKKQKGTPNVANCPAANTRFHNRKSSTSTTLKKKKKQKGKKVVKATRMTKRTKSWLIRTKRAAKKAAFLDRIKISSDRKNSAVELPPADFGNISIPAVDPLTIRLKVFDDDKNKIVAYAVDNDEAVSELMCQKCTDVAITPMRVSCCQRTCCFDCLPSDGAVCPLADCKRVFRDVSYCHDIDDRISALKIHCPYGCGWFGELKDHLEHSSLHCYQADDSLRIDACNVKRFVRSEVNKHIQQVSIHANELLLKVRLDIRKSCASTLFREQCDQLMNIARRMDDWASNAQAQDEKLKRDEDEREKEITAAERKKESKAANSVIQNKARALEELSNSISTQTFGGGVHQTFDYSSWEEIHEWIEVYATKLHGVGTEIVCADLGCGIFVSIISGAAVIANSRWIGLEIDPNRLHLGAEIYRMFLNDWEKVSHDKRSLHVGFLEADCTKPLNLRGYVCYLF